MKRAILTVVAGVIIGVGSFAQTAKHSATFIQVDHGVYTFEYRNTVNNSKVHQHHTS
jgi:hypothetical protein